MSAPRYAGVTETARGALSARTARPDSGGISATEPQARIDCRTAALWRCPPSSASYDRRGQVARLTGMPW